jgi:thiamine-phosphate diphosphorylase/hydroxyethylthiazole kinase
MVKPTIDYSLYLVTGRDLLPAGKVRAVALELEHSTAAALPQLARADYPCGVNVCQDYYESLEEALQGGVTVVQIREKEADTGEFLDVALKSKAICDRVSRPRERLAGYCFVPPSHLPVGLG